MTIGELVFWYACVFFVLLLALTAALLWHKFDKKKFSQIDWSGVFARAQANLPGGEFWLKTVCAAITALAAGSAVVIFLLPYGSGLALAALSIIGLALLFGLPKLLA